MKFLPLIGILMLPLSSCAQDAPLQIALHTWATGLDRPVWITNAGDDRLFVVEQDGVIKIITDSMQVASTPFLDINSLVNSSGNEQGLLGLAFDPEYATNGYFFVYYTFGSGAGTSRIARYSVSSDPDVADAQSGEVIYTRVQPFTNHNGGCLQFGPDGYLYCGFGDGGDGNDPYGNGQNLSNVLGDMIRIDVSQPDTTYMIPSDNPWVSASDTLPEIWASGLRNPWRYSFDRLTGDLWIGDVGQNAWEEVDHWPAGDNSGPNFGWRCREGAVATPGVSQSGCVDASGYVAPVAAFDHANQGWCSVIGGNVYRGAAFPNLQGKYIFTDYCAGDFLTFDEDMNVDTLLMTDNYGYSGFGEGLDGEMYVTDVEHGTVNKIVDACPMDPPTIDQNGAELQSSDADAYAWYLNGAPIIGATGQSYDALVNGAYQVRASFGGPCALFSDTAFVISVSIDEVVAPALTLWPQPAQNVLHVTSEHMSQQGADLEIVDSTGRTVRNMHWSKGTTELNIPVAGLPDGAYSIQTRDAGGRMIRQSFMVIR